VPQLPDFDPQNQINRSPHVVILGAGASRAAFPNGDANGKRLPVLADLPDCLDLRTSLSAAGFSVQSDFESIYDELATSGRHPGLKAEIESRVRSYFESLALPTTPTLYDYLILALRENDLIATFNWDPFLAQAYMRNCGVAKLPQLAFLHGNAGMAVCLKDRITGFRGEKCQKCGQPMQPTTLLYPVRDKDYTSDAFIANEWSRLKSVLNKPTCLQFSAIALHALTLQLLS